MPLDLGIVADAPEPLEAAIRAARDARADVLVTLGGASVGDHDLVKPALAREGMELGFWRIAMRPGKPLIHGRLGSMAILGLPGNPVSSIVCGALFLVPLLRALSGDPAAAHDRSEPAILGAALPRNDRAPGLHARDADDARGRHPASRCRTRPRIPPCCACWRRRSASSSASPAPRRRRPARACRILRFEQGW